MESGIVFYAFKNVFTTARDIFIRADLAFPPTAPQAARYYIGAIKNVNTPIVENPVFLKNKLRAEPGERLRRAWRHSVRSRSPPDLRLPEFRRVPMPAVRKRSALIDT
jgi:hypothetical protein